MKDTARLILALAAALAVALLALVVVAHAEPPAGADPALVPWFQSLTRPDVTGPYAGMASCCGTSDAHLLDYRLHEDRYQILWRERWVDVPPEKVLPRADNPTGRGVAFFNENPDGSLTWFCFVRAQES